MRRVLIGLLLLVSLSAFLNADEKVLLGAGGRGQFGGLGFPFSQRAPVSLYNGGGQAGISWFCYQQAAFEVVQGVYADYFHLNLKSEHLSLLTSWDLLYMPFYSEQNADSFPLFFDLGLGMGYSLLLEYNTYSTESPVSGLDWINSAHFMYFSLSAGAGYRFILEDHSHLDISGGYDFKFLLAPWNYWGHIPVNSFFLKFVYYFSI